MEDKARIELLVQQLNAASNAYYGGQEEPMSNYEWDKKFDELNELEQKTGYILPDSPTHSTSHSEEEGGEKEPHEFPALSLAKTKKVEELQKWAGDLPIWLSWKLDGLTLVATWDGGELTKILTRGNGIVGSNITYLKGCIRGIPLKIEYKGHLVVRGEATISYTDFETINAALDDEDDKFANPRNLASGTLALDVSNRDKVKERGVTFNAFTLVHLDEEIVSWGARMDFLDQQGFITVDRELTDAAGIPAVVEKWTHRVESGQMDIPVDGLVIAYDDTVYAAGGSVTGHHATRGGFAFKWQDEAADTRLDHIEWSCAASTITPVAVCDPVQLEGTTVKRASLCNLSELDRLGIGEDGKCVLKLIKANKIIPKCIQVVSAEGRYSVPEKCPVCGSPTEVKTSASGIRTLHCGNPDCAAKNLMKFNRFVSKPGMNIDGISLESLRDFINEGFIRRFDDIYSLSEHAEVIREMEGYGERSCEKLMAAIEKSRRDVNPVNLIYALCIPMIGVDAGKRLMAGLGWKGFVERLESGEGFEHIDGLGGEKSGALLAWYADAENRRLFESLTSLLEVRAVEPVTEKTGTCAGLTFVITGDVHSFKNRDEFKAYVEGQGGHVAGSVSKKTAYLVNNDVTSASAKNTKARSLGIPILSEDEFIEKFGR